MSSGLSSAFNSAQGAATRVFNTGMSSANKAVNASVAKRYGKILFAGVLRDIDNADALAAHNSGEIYNNMETDAVRILRELDNTKNRPAYINILKMMLKLNELKGKEYNSTLKNETIDKINTAISTMSMGGSRKLRAHPTSRGTRRPRSRRIIRSRRPRSRRNRH